MKKLKEGLIDFLKKLTLLFIGWGLGPLLKAYSWLSKKTGRLKIIGSFPKGGGLLIVGNHETFGEPPEVTVELYLSDTVNFTNPIKYFPWTMQAEDNFLKYLFFLRAYIAIWVDRRKITSRFIALRKAKRILDARGNIVLFPGGMRDYHTVQEVGDSEDNESLGKLFDGAAWLVIHCPGVRVVPVGTRGYTNFVPNDRLPIPRPWAKREIRIGKPLEFSPDASIDEITMEIKKAILEQKNRG